MKKAKKLKFTDEVIKELKTYVYRLIDPRNGETFYVGKGVGNRVFDHAKGAIKKIEKEEKKKIEEDTEIEEVRIEDSLSLKENRIKEIDKLGLKPIHIIHRHGLDDRTATEVEAALIDAYPGLTNIKNGINSEYGSMTPLEVLNKYQAEVADFKNLKCVIIKINRSAINNISIYDATRFAWRLNKERVVKSDYVLAVEKGIIVGVFVARKWLMAKEEYFPEFLNEIRNNNTKGRYGFIGVEAEDDIRELFIGKRLPEEYMKKGASNPIQYNYS